MRTIAITRSIISAINFISGILTPAKYSNQWYPTHYGAYQLTTRVDKTTEHTDDFLSITCYDQEEKCCC